jgi:hypothetical protein
MATGLLPKTENRICFRSSLLSNISAKEGADNKHFGRIYRREGISVNLQTAMIPLIIRFESFITYNEILQPLLRNFFQGLSYYFMQPSI